MCVLLMIAMFVYGIVILVRGKFLFTGGREVCGKPARVIGILLMAPVPLLFLLGAILAMVTALLQQKETIESLETATGLLVLAIPLCCLFAALSIAGRTSQIGGEETLRPQGSIDRAKGLPAEYGEHFQPATEKGNITDGAVRPQHPAENRIQE